MAFDYIVTSDLYDIYKYEMTESQLLDAETSLVFACERINSITGGQIERIGFSSLTAIQQQLVKRASCRMMIYYLEDGHDFIRASTSIQAGSFSSSQTPPADPDYVPDEVYNLLRSAGLYRQFIPVQFQYGCDTEKECKSVDDIRAENYVQTWDVNKCMSFYQAVKTFLRAQNTSVFPLDDSIYIEYFNDPYNARIGIKAQVKLPTIGDGLVIDASNILKVLINPDSINYLEASAQGIRFKGTAQVKYGLGLKYDETTNTVSVSVSNDPNKDDIHLYIDETGIHGDFSASGQAKIDLKQNVTDNNLKTIAKTIVGSINEVYLWKNDSSILKPNTSSFSEGYSSIDISGDNEERKQLLGVKETQIASGAVPYSQLAFILDNDKVLINAYIQPLVTEVDITGKDNKPILLYGVAETTNPTGAVNLTQLNNVQKNIEKNYVILRWDNSNINDSNLVGIPTLTGRFYKGTTRYLFSTTEDTVANQSTAKTGVFVQDICFINTTASASVTRSAGLVTPEVDVASIKIYDISITDQQLTINGYNKQSTIIFTLEVDISDLG